MNRRILSLVTLVVVVAIAAYAVWHYRSQGAAQQQVQNASQAPVAALLALGTTAPEFQAASTHGSFDLAKTKKPVFLEVFATWCPHCQRETAVLNRLYPRFKNNVDFIAVSGSGTGMDGLAASPNDVLQFAQRFNVKYPIAFDGTLTVANEYLQGGFPTIVIIASNKKIVYLASGEIPEATLAAQLQKVK